MKYYNYYVAKEAVKPIFELLEQFSERTRLNRQFQYYYIVDYILRNIDKTNNNVPVNQATLAKILGINNKLCSHLMKDLVSKGIIEVTCLHRQGFNSTRFSIPEAYQDFLSIAVPIKDYLPLKKIIQRRNAQSESFKNTIEGSLYLNYIDKITIINTDYIYNYIDSMYIFLPNMDKRVKIKVMKREKTNVKRILDGDFWVKRPVEKSRVYCNLSILHREHRKHLRFEGQSLKAVDIRNSQPMLAGVYIKSELIKQGREIPSDLKLYIDRCEQGFFYDDFMGEVEDRKQFKQDFFREVFFSRVTNRKTKLKKMFIAKYPNVYEIICDIKGGIGSDSYADFAINLQKFEASIIFDAVNLSLLKEGYPCFNIYDSIVSHSEEVLEEATKRIYKEFAKYGVRPTLNVENFNN